MNTLLNNLTEVSNFKYTENGGLAHKTSGFAVYDLFALGGSYRSRSDTDCIFLFKKAFEEDEMYALKCLFYLRDARGGAGERRFFRVCMKWLANEYPEAAKRNFKHIAEMGRWDDFYIFVGTKLEKDMFDFMRHQFALDLECQTPSLLAKWLKSINASSTETKRLGRMTARAFGMTERQYRKSLAILRTRINVLEKLMSENRWDEIVFDSIPSKAGLIYKNAFARHDVERIKAGAQTYEEFAKSKDTKVNADALFPYDIVDKALQSRYPLGSTDRLMIEKYWENQKDYLNGKSCKMMCVVDTSGSMWGAPINVAISLGMYCAERVGGPFKDHYISFSRHPQLIKIEGVDFVDKVRRIYNKNLCENTDLIKTFELVREMSLKSRPEDRLDTIVVISDMEIDAGASGYRWMKDALMTDMEVERQRWEACGLTMPHLVYWNVNARHDTVLDKGPNITLVSGASPTIFQQVVTGKTGLELMYEALDAPRYSEIY